MGIMSTYLKEGKYTEKFIREYLCTPIKVVKLMINNECQFNCKHCLYGYTESKGETLSLDETYKLIDELELMGVEYLDFMGKEPLIDDKAFKILEYISERRYRFKSAIVTNGMTVEKYIEQLKVYKPTVILSVESFKSIESRNTNTHLVSNIKTLVENDVPIELTVDVHLGNYTEIESIAREAYDLGVGKITFKTLSPIGQGRDYVKSTLLSKTELIYIINTLAHIEDLPYFQPKLELNLHERDILKGSIAYEVVKHNIINYNYSKYHNLELIMEYDCFKMLGTAYITSDGYVLHCGADVSRPKYHESAVGNIREESYIALQDRGKRESLNTILSNKSTSCPNGGCIECQR